MAVVKMINLYPVYTNKSKKKMDDFNNPDVLIKRWFLTLLFGGAFNKICCFALLNTGSNIFMLFRIYSAKTGFLFVFKTVGNDSKRRLMWM